MKDDEYTAEVRRRIVASIESGMSDLTSVLQRCEGADPALVATLLQQESGRTHSGVRTSTGTKVLSVFDLPAPDPERSQWWFSTTGLRVVVELLLQRLALIDIRGRILCLGCPSVAAALSHFETQVVAKDIDPDVIQMLRRRLPRGDIQEYDVAAAPPAELNASCVLAVVDPPWYDAAIVTFLNRALSAVSMGGEVICTLPGRLTRPGIETSRARLVAELTSLGHEILGIERGVVSYQVPQFEEVALGRLEGFRGIPWRSGDLLHFRKRAEAGLPPENFASKPVEAFSRSPTQYRVFLRGTASADARIPTLPLRNYSAHISTRAHEGEVPDVWSSTKVGLHVGSHPMVRSLVSCWADGQDKEQAIATLVSDGEAESYGRRLADELDDHLALWTKHASASPLPRADREGTLEFLYQACHSPTGPRTHRGRRWFSRDIQP